MEKNYNLYSLIGIGRNASEEAIANRIERIKRLKNDYSEELFKKIEEEYKLFLEDRNLYDKKIGINSDENIDDNQQENKKTYYTNNNFKSSEEKSDNIGVVDKSGVEKTYDPIFDDQYAFVKLANESYLKKKKEENDIINQREAERSYKIYKESNGEIPRTVFLNVIRGNVGKVIAEEFISFVEAEHSPLIAYEDVFTGEVLSEEVKEKVKEESHTRLYLCANNILKALETQLTAESLSNDFYLERLIEFLKVYPTDLMVGIMKDIKSNYPVIYEKALNNEKFIESYFESYSMIRG